MRKMGNCVESQSDNENVEQNNEEESTDGQEDQGVDQELLG